MSVCCDGPLASHKLERPFWRLQQVNVIKITPLTCSPCLTCRGVGEFEENYITDHMRVMNIYYYDKLEFGDQSDCS
jgi:hypothetical protein